MRRLGLTQRRKMVGLSQEQLADELGVDRSTVVRWERGETAPQPWHRPNLASALRLSLDQLDSLIAHQPLWSETFAPPPAKWIGGPDDAAAIRSFRIADRESGGARLYPAVTGYLQHRLAPRLFGLEPVGDGDGLFAAAAGLTEMAGWMAHDTGRDDLARHHFQRALPLAEAGRDRHLVASICASISHLSLHQYAADAAAAAAQRGLAIGPSRTRIVARLHAMEARRYAMLRRPDDCADHLRRAERALEGNTDEAISPWVSPFDQAALAAEAARCFRDLGRSDLSKRHAQRVVEQRSADRVRSRALARLLIMSVAIADGAADEACSVGREVLRDTRAVHSALLVQQLREAGRSLGQQARSPEVTAFLQLLREELLHRRKTQWFTTDSLTAGTKAI